MKIVDRIILLLNYIFIVCILISCFSPFVSPQNFTFIAYFGLAFPVLFVINCVLVIYWIARWKKQFVISLVVILAGWPMISDHWTISVNSGKGSAGNKIKIMSYNVRLFDLYNWPHNTETRNKIFDIVKVVSPDILCFQEFYANELGTFNTLDTLREFQKAKNYHVEYMATASGKHHYGLATFTTYPIVNKGTVDIFTEHMNACIYTDIKIDSDTVRVYNMHLQSVHLSTIYYTDTNYFETKEVYEQEAGNILKRLFYAFSKRAVQADVIAKHISKCRYPVIVCADLNDTPSSYTYRTIRGKLKDAFTESGNGFGVTYAGKIPFLRIDYILHSAALDGSDFSVIPEKLSDHYPVCCSVIANHKE